MVLAEQPLCVRCLERGEVRLAEHVHHVRPLVAGGTNERENLMPLCRQCHAEIHTAANATPRFTAVRGRGILKFSRSRRETGARASLARAQVLIGGGRGCLGDRRLSRPS